MKQFNQIGKRIKKDDFLNARRGRTFVSPQNKEYQLDYEKIGRIYHIVIIYLGKRWRMNEPDFNRSNINDILNSIENSNQINN